MSRVSRRCHTQSAQEPEAQVEEERAELEKVVRECEHMTPLATDTDMSVRGAGVPL